MSTENLQIFSERLKERRKALRLTLQDIATPLGVTTSAVAAWERGESFPKRGKEDSLAEILQTNRKWLLAEEGSPSGGDSAETIKVLARLCDKTEAEFLDYLLKRYGARAAEELKSNPNGVSSTAAAVAVTGAKLAAALSEKEPKS